MVNFYRCPMCGGVLYNNNYAGEFLNPNFLQSAPPVPINNYLVQNNDVTTPTLIPVNELGDLKGKQIQTSIQNLGTVTACVGDYDPIRNRVPLSNIKNIQTGENHGDMDFLPTELVGYRVISETCPESGTTDGRVPPPDRRIPEEQLAETTVIRKTITSFGIPAPILRDPFRTRTYRVWLDVTVPVVIRNQAQEILDRCMTEATNSIYQYLAPYVASAVASLNPGPVVAAIPGAIGTATQTFTLCVGSNPIIYPYMNRIKLDIGSGYD